MNKIPTQLENPKGLHQRYQIKKLVPIQGTFMGLPMEEPHMELTDCDEDSEYFVMRLDTGGSDLKHIEACRIGIHAYADAIYPHLPELAIDLKTRYPLLNHTTNT